MTDDATQHSPIPRLPVLGWQTFRGEHRAQVPSLLDRADLIHTTSGRAAILLAMEALGVGAHSKVLVPTYHCPTMVAPIDALGAQPIFYPLDQNGSARLDWLEAMDCSGVQAILAAHFFGLPQPMAGLRRWCDLRGVALIEDCAHALFGGSEGRPLGAWGDIAIGSLTKFMPVPEGGCMLLNATRFAKPRLRPARWRDQFKAALDIVEVGVMHRRLHGLNFVLSSILDGKRLLRRSVADPAATNEPVAGGSGSPEFDGFVIDSDLAHRELSAPCRWVSSHTPRARNISRRRHNYRFLAHALGASKSLRPLMPALPEDSAPYVFPLWVERPDPGYAELRRLRMPVSRWDRLWPGVPRLPGDVGVDWSSHVLQLACHQDLTEPELQRLADVLVQLYASGTTEGP